MVPILILNPGYEHCYHNACIYEGLSSFGIGMNYRPVISIDICMYLNLSLVLVWRSRVMGVSIDRRILVQ